MRESLKKLIKRHPLLIKIIKRIQRKAIFKTSYRKVIIGKGNKIRADTTSIFINCRFDIVGDNNSIVIDQFTLFTNVTFYIRGNSNSIFISKSVAFNHGGSLWIEDNNCEIKIGEGSTFEDVHLAATEPGSKITIGEDCMFANDIDVRTGDSHSIIDSSTLKRINFAQNVAIDNHVWIASHVSILKGVKILKNTVVATHSVVTKSFDKDGILIGGIPSRILKTNINWDRIRIYEK